MKQITLHAVSLLLAGALCSRAQESAPTSLGPGMSPVTAAAIEVGSKEPWRYLLYLPERYFRATDQPLPLLLFLHGSSGRGQNLDIVKRYGPPSRLKGEADFPMAMVAPQLPGGGWDPGSVLALLDEVLGTYRLDPDRVYLTGVSLGGQGSWGVAAGAPERFAAFAPVCGYGGGNARSVSRMAKLPIWAFHGALDDIVPLAPHKALVDQVNQAGGAAKLTIFEQGDHGNIIVPIYGRESGGRLYTWFLGHRRGQPAAAWGGEARLERLPGPGMKAPVSAPSAPVSPALPPAMPSGTEPSAATPDPRPGEFWDQLFRFLEKGAAKPVPPSEGAEIGGAQSLPVP